ncbi:MAG: D-alanyl-D-alanine carboxypeptidase/D-alanyl-D-alanine-endopeptidase [Pseudomonadota bacterium]
MSLRAARPLRRRAILSFFVAASLAGSAFATAPESSLRPLLKPGDAEKRAVTSASTIMKESGLGGHISFVVADAATGEVLERHSALRAHPPASVTKAVTALYALETLGADYRFSTLLMGTGPIANGVLKGDLILAGDGDPVLTSDDLLDLASAMKDAGVASVDGRFLIYDAALPWVREIDTAQPIQVGYNPGVSGLNLNFNRVFLEWTPQGGDYSVTLEARSERVRPDVSVAQAEVVEGSGPVFTYEQTPSGEFWTVNRKALGKKKGGRWLPVRGPGAYAGDVMQTLARSHGIVIRAPQRIADLPDGAETIVTHESPELEEIVRDMLKYSTNLTAEALGLRASGARSLPGSGAAMSEWAKSRFGARRPDFADHSGLGDQTKLTAFDMTRMLTAPGAQTLLAPLLKELRVLDAKGDLDTSSGRRIFAKTGTLNFVSGLAGYVTTPQGRDLAFAIYTSDLERRSKLSRAERERPRGARGWNSRSRRMQQRLIARWSTLYSDLDQKAELTE